MENKECVESTALGTILGEDNCAEITVLGSEFTDRTYRDEKTTVLLLRTTKGVYHTSSAHVIKTIRESESISKPFNMEITAKKAKSGRTYYEAKVIELKDFEELPM